MGRKVGQLSGVPKLQSCLGVGVENSSPKKIVRVEKMDKNVENEFY